MAAWWYHEKSVSLTRSASRVERIGVGASVKKSSKSEGGEGERRVCALAIGSQGIIWDARHIVEIV